MSKRSEKIAQRKAEQVAFLKTRRKDQLKLLELNLEQATTIYDSLKSTASDEDLAYMANAISMRDAEIKSFREEWDLEEETQS
jgi:hypothetical protein